MTDPGPGRASRLWPIGVCLILALVQVVIALAGSGTYDTFRDFYYAAGIVQGAEFPLSGPLVYNTIHLGPIWYYVLAGFLAFGGLAGGVVGITLINGTKYWLCWVLVGRLFDRPTGAIATGIYALIGWAVFPAVFLTHASVVETMSLASILGALWLADRPGIWRAVCYGLLCAFAVHAHPTSLTIIGVPAVWVLWQLRQRFDLLALVAFGAAAPFFPYLIDQHGQGYPDFVALGQYGTKAAGHPLDWSRWLALWSGLFWNGVDGTYRLFLPDWAAIPVRWVWSALLALSVVGLGLATRQKNRIPILLTVWITFHFLFLILIRDITPYWMLFSVVPVGVVLMATCLRHLNNGVVSTFPVSEVPGRFLQYGSLTVLSIGLVTQLALSWAIIAIEDELTVPVLEPGNPGFMDVRARFKSVQTVSFSQVDFLDEAIISNPDCEPTVFRGHWAHLLDASLGAGVRLRCGDGSSVRLGGPRSDGVRERAGFSRGMIKSLGWPNDGQSIQSVKVRQIIYSGPSLQLPDPATFPPRRNLAPAELHPFEFTAKPNSTITLSNRTDGYFALELDSAQCNGRVAKLYRDPHAIALRCLSEQARIDWRIAIHTSADVLEVLEIEPGAN